MKRAAPILAALVLVACTTTGTRGPQAAGPTRAVDPASQDAAIDAPIAQFLLASAATDFQTHRPPHPPRFRDVHSGYVTNADGGKQYMLCGQFRPAQETGEGEWTQFVTLKTSGYEQLIGDQATTWCRHLSITGNEEDLSSSLQSRVDSPH